MMVNRAAQVLEDRPAISPTPLSPSRLEISQSRYIQAADRVCFSLLLSGCSEYTRLTSRLLGIAGISTNTAVLPVFHIHLDFTVHIHYFLPMHLKSLPALFKGDQSPMLQTDSPFPPLRAEHRYKSVYERAGFDVNLSGKNGQRSTPGSRKHLPTTTACPPFPPTHNNGRKFNESLRLLPQQSTTRRVLPPMSVQSQQQQPKFGNRAMLNLYTNHSASSHGHVPGGANYNTANTEMMPLTPQTAYTLYLAPVSAVDAPSPSHSDIPTPERAPNRPKYAQFQQFEPFRPVQPAGGAAVAEAAAELSVSERNKKNLSLHIDNHQSNNTMLSEITSPGLDMDPDSRQSTPVTSDGEYAGPAKSVLTSMSVKTSELMDAPYPADDEPRDLSLMLEGFRLEVQQQRGDWVPIDQQSQNLHQYHAYEPQSQQQQPQYQQYQQQQLQKQQQQQHDRQFQSFDDQSRYANPSPHSEYSLYLHSALPRDPRASHMLTISSVLSNPDAEDPVEAELERQLQDLKTGSEFSYERRGTEDSFVTAQDVPIDNLRSQIPTFNIQTADDLKNSQISEENDDTDREDTQAFGSPENTRPLFEDNPAQFQAPETPLIGRDVYTAETPETIQPLSPKTHRVQEELSNLNFQAPELEETSLDRRSFDDEFVNDSRISDIGSSSRIDHSDFPEVVSEKSYRSEDHYATEEDSSILGQNPAPSEFNAFPRSMIGTNIPHFRMSDLMPKNPPGYGPCRGCANEVDKHARGPQKAIYSKTGELSGQWHRECFTCSYSGCNVGFSKHVACYALLDNAFCNFHYHMLNGTLCETCHMGIEGECIENELKQKWHISCLKCLKCNNTINTDYYLINNEIMCEADAAKVIRSLEQSGMTSNDKIEKRRTRMLFIDQQFGV